METNHKEVIESLNNLIQINNDRIQGYLTASKETEETDLKSLFFELMQTSQECRRELNGEVMRLGGTPITGTTVSGKFFRLWMDVKAALTRKDRKAILNSCEFGEDFAVKVYELELEGDILSTPAYVNMLKNQYVKIKSGHDSVKALRDGISVY